MLPPRAAKHLTWSHFRTENRISAFPPENALIRGQRVPKRQESVKVEALDRLHRAGGLDPSRERSQAERVKDGDRRRMQKRQIAEPIAQPEVADRRLRVDVLRVGEPGDSSLLVAQFVHELKRNALAPGEYAPIRDAVERGLI